MAKKSPGAKPLTRPPATAAALTGADAFFRRTGKVIVPLTVKDILEEQLARKLV